MDLVDVIFGLHWANAAITGLLFGGIVFVVWALLAWVLGGGYE